EHLVSRGLRLPPESCNCQQRDGTGYQCDLKTSPIQIPREIDCKPGSNHTRQYDKHRSQCDCDKIKMPRHMSGEPEGRQQWRDQKKKCPGSQQRGFNEFPAENGMPC